MIGVAGTAGGPEAFAVDVSLARFFDSALVVVGGSARFSGERLLATEVAAFAGGGFELEAVPVGGNTGTGGNTRAGFGAAALWDTGV